MSRAFGQVAEKLRVAGRLLEEAAQQTHAGAEAAHADLHRDLRSTAAAASVLWGGAASLAGKEYLDSLQQEQRNATALKCGELFGRALMLDRAGLQELLDNPDFIYRREVEIILQLRCALDGEGRHG